MRVCVLGGGGDVETDRNMHCEERGICWGD